MAARDSGRASCLLALLLPLACGPADDGPTLDLPPRPAAAATGSGIVAEISDTDLQAREERIYTEVARGNVPPWLRRLRRVEFEVDLDGVAHEVTFWAAPDYLAVGSDDDYFFVPLSPRTAARIADLAGASLPTPRMVDAIWASARVRLTPIRIQPDEHMGSVRYFRRHDRLVQAQRSQHGAGAGRLIAGHKLDVVRRAAPADSLPFGLYGWHFPDGRILQPLYPIPEDSRPYFSMGVRLVDRRIRIDGVEHDIAEVLADPELARLLDVR